MAITNSIASGTPIAEALRAQNPWASSPLGRVERGHERSAKLRERHALGVGEQIAGRGEPGRLGDRVHLGVERQVMGPRAAGRSPG